MLKTDIAPKVKYRKDYEPPAFTVDNMNLTYQLHDDKTLVIAETVFKRNGKNQSPLILDGSKLSLKEIKINGQPLDQNAYTLNDQQLIINNVPDQFTLSVTTEIHPETNTSLEGLYKSNTMFCTQCEPEGFRTITYALDRPDVMTTYTVRIEADKTKYPVLLSNGNCTAKGDLPDNRHFTVWHDPFKKPSYLFALVAGDLAHIHDRFTTMSGRVVDLYIYTEKGNEDKCHHAMTSLKKSMKWDEDVYGREYDLDLFNIVAVNDFNFGAMENKSLNIFNSKLVFAKPDTATDADYLAIEGVVAHEYFHNWTGNRITCRDWFQLTLKEGLTVLRDQCFSADMNNQDVQRIDDVSGLRAVQFVEDSGPMAHPIRPESYIEMNNFYTATVYEKGAEVLRMLKIILGDDLYRKGTDLYFDRHDGQAVTCDDFVQCMQDASGIDLEQFKKWYRTAGTPNIDIKTSYDAQKKQFHITFTQSHDDPLHIPVAIGLLNAKGQDILKDKTTVLHFKGKTQTFTFNDIDAKPIPSLFRAFSAPVKVTSDLSDDDLKFLMIHDSDGFNKWDAGQTYMQRTMLKMISAHQAGHRLSAPQEFIDVFASLLKDNKTPPMLLARAITLPSYAYLTQLMPKIDVDAILAVSDCLEQAIGKTFKKELEAIYQAQSEAGAFSITPEAMGKRALKNTALAYLVAADGEKANPEMAQKQFNQSKTMTDKISALVRLCEISHPARTEALQSFYDQHKDDPNVLDKWFSVQVRANRTDSLDVLKALMAHPDFTLKNPNRLRAVIGVFANANPRAFHAIDGSGYKILADTVILLNNINPMTAARILTPMREWERYDDQRKTLMKNELLRILNTPDLSNDVFEIVSKSLGEQHAKPNITNKISR